MGVEDYNSTDKIKEAEKKVTVGSAEFSENLNNFLNDITENQNEIISILESQEIQELKDRLENFLQSQNPEDKNKVNLLKFKLATCEPKDIAGIIAEHVGYKIGNTDVGVQRDVSNNGISISSMNQAVQNEAEAVQNEAEAVQNEAEAVQNEAEAAQNEAEAAQNKAEATQNENQRVENRENLDEHVALTKSIQERDNLLNNLAGRDSEKAAEIDKKTREKAELAKQQLPEETKRQLEKSGYDENFIDNYLLVKVTLNEVKNDSSFTPVEIADFEQSVGDLDSSFKLSNRDVLLKSIDNACNIPDTSLSSFSSENIAKTRTELFNEDIGNESLIQARKNNIESHAEAYAEIFLEMGTDEVIAKYGKFLEGDLKEFWQQYESNRDVIKNKIAEIGIMIKNQQIFGENGENYLSDEEKILWNNYKKMLSVTNEIRKETEEQTKNLMEEMCIISQIKGMYMCMGEGDDFNLNKANEIRYDEQGAMILDGHVDGVAFSIRQDINNPEAKLQTSQKLARSADGNVFSIGGTDNFVDSNFILPSQNKIFESIVATVQSDKSLENYDNQDEYLENLQKNIIGTMEKIYKDTEYVHHYMQGQVSGENIINETMNLISEKCPNIANDEESLKNINQDENKDKDLFDFFKILKFNIDNSTNTEKDHLNQCVLKILEITNNYANNNGKESSISFKYPPIIENFLKNENWLTGGNENSRLSSLSELFKYYSEKSADARSNSEGTGNSGISSKMIINDLYIDLFESNNGKNLSQTAELYNGEKQKEEEKKQYEENKKQYEENKKQYEEKEEQDKNEAYSKLMEQWPPED